MSGSQILCSLVTGCEPLLISIIERPAYDHPERTETFKTDKPPEGAFKKKKKTHCAALYCRSPACVCDRRSRLVCLPQSFPSQQ